MAILPPAKSKKEKSLTALYALRGPDFKNLDKWVGGYSGSTLAYRLGVRSFF